MNKWFIGFTGLGTCLNLAAGTVVAVFSEGNVKSVIVYYGCSVILAILCAWADLSWKIERIKEA